MLNTIGARRTNANETALFEKSNIPPTSSINPIVGKI